MPKRSCSSPHLTAAKQAVASVLTLLTLLVSPVVSHAEGFRFAVIGDLPYGSSDERNLVDVFEDIGKSDSRFVIHLGDIKSGSEYCGDELLNRRIEALNQSPKPLIYTPGDNEWTDCHRRPAGRFDPVERLKWLRQRAFSQPRSLGQNPLPLESQAALTDADRGLPENLRWLQSGVLFITFNIPGSNNNYWAQHAADHERNVEWQQRMPLVLGWLGDSIARARNSDVRGVVLAFQGNPFERDSAEQQSKQRDGFREWRDALALQLKSLGKPALLIHGDTHSHRVDQSLTDEQGQPVKNVTRLEAFGYPFTRNWVEVVVDPAKPGLFEIRQKRLFQCNDC